MNGRMAKALRKKTRKTYRKKLRELKDGDFTERVAMAWWLLFGR